MKKSFGPLALLLLNLFVLPFDSVRAQEPEVIFLTLDGIPIEVLRKEWREPRLLKRTLEYVKANGGIGFGTARRYRMKVSNLGVVSKPGYRALMMGRFEKDCRRNGCSEPLAHPTLLDGLAELGIDSARDAAIFTAWNAKADVLTKNNTPYEGSVGFEPVKAEGVSEELRQKLEELRSVGKPNTELPHPGSDGFVGDLGLAYLTEKRPRFTWMSFVDSDDWAHEKNRKEFEGVLKNFDLRFQALIELLSQTPGRLENTSIVLSDDHGRGFWFLWYLHGAIHPTSHNMFTFVVPSRNLRDQYVIQRSKPRGRFRQSQVRATIEELLSPGSALHEKLGHDRPLIKLRSRADRGPASEISGETREKLSALRTKVRAWARECPDGSMTNSRCPHGDTTIFAGMLCLSGETRRCDDVKNAQGAGGEWFRSPHLKDVRNPDGHPTFSRDQARGVLAYLIATRDVEAAKSWMSFIRGNRYHLCTKETKFWKWQAVCGITPTFWPTMTAVWEYLGLPRERPMKEWKEEFDRRIQPLQTKIQKNDYPLHLAGLNVWLSREVALRTGNYPNALKHHHKRMAKILNQRNPENPFYRYLRYGADETSAQTVLRHCPETISPDRGYGDWMWQRPIKDNVDGTSLMTWDYPGGHECIFMINLLIGAD